MAMSATANSSSIAHQIQEVNSSLSEANNRDKPQKKSKRGIRRKAIEELEEGERRGTHQEIRREKEDEKLEPLPKRERKANEEESISMIFNHSPPMNLKLTISNGIRYLEPYWSTFNGFAKRRWIGRTVNNVFTEEFLIYHPLYPRAAIRKGRLFINGKQMCNPDYRFRENDRFFHLTHRHETEIPAVPIEVITETDDYLVLNKPPGLPVHPCGQYNVHSVTSLLKREYGRKDSDELRPLHRLDRNTTGILMFAKNYEADIRFKKAMKNRKLYKEYVAEVEGIFPEEEINCNEPIGILSPQTGIRCISVDGLDALSRFRRISVKPKENSSVISCKIETGRTHQIRVHLQYLGFPIVKDDIYNDDAWGPARGKNCNYGKPIEQVRKDILTRHDKKNWEVSFDPEYEKRLREIGDDEMYEPEDFDLLRLRLEELPNHDPICRGCAVYKKREMVKQDWQMHLHCWRYSSEDWAFEAPLPEWAKSALIPSPVPLIEEEKRQSVMLTN